jgi:ABC-type histidine transport system ATPase subunit
MALLELDDVHTYYGNIAALKGVSRRARSSR